MNAPQIPASRIEFWFEFGSNYSYLSVMRIEAAAAERGVRILWKPFLLGPIFKELGWDTSPFVLQKEKGAYAFKDMERQCRKYGLPWRQPGVFPRKSLLAMRVAMLGAEQPWMAEYSRRVMLLNFAEDRDIDSAANIGALLDGMGLPAAQLLQQAQEEDNKQRLRRQTAEARARGVFGAPSFFVGDELFWGNDRLDDALEFAAP